MNEMTLTLNGEFIQATQCTNKYRGIEQSVRCTAQESYTENGYVSILTPVPKGLQVFGQTTMGVVVQGNIYQEMQTGDWYLIRPGDTMGIIMDDPTFKYVFRNELGI